MTFSKISIYSSFFLLIFVLLSLLIVNHFGKSLPNQNVAYVDSSRVEYLKNNGVRLMPFKLLGRKVNSRDLKWIDTVDTSNPVTAGMEGTFYTSNGLTEKPEAKLFTKMYDKVRARNLQQIEYNIKKFGEFCNFA